MADRGLHAYVVPSTRAGQRPDPAARRQALSGLMAGGFLLAIIAAVLAIVIAAPQYAEPSQQPAGMAAASGEPDAVVAAEQGEGRPPEMTSAPPSELKGYRWPVRGNGSIVDTYYGQHKSGRFEISGTRIHDGIVITWFEGAAVKAAHGGRVVATGDDWVRHAGYDGSVEDAIESFDQRAKKRAKRTGGQRERFPQGVVIDDGNGYYSIYTELKDLLVKKGDRVTAGQTIGRMSRAEGKQMMRYRLVRMDGPLMKVHASDRALGYPDYASERIDPLAVLPTDVRKMPKLKGKRPANPPHLSEY